MSDLFISFYFFYTLKGRNESQAELDYTQQYSVITIMHSKTQSSKKKQKKNMLFYKNDCVMYELMLFYHTVADVVLLMPASDNYLSH